jgi:cell division protein FtsI (penicillin-binding protein 3)
MAALEDGKINLDDTVNASGVYQYRGGKLTDSNKYGYGKITIRKAFEKSSNVISKIINTAYRDEPELFLKHLKEFGLTEALGIDIKGEVAPVVHYPGTKGWSGLTLPWMAIGYEFQQTPLQTLAFYNAVANNGTLVRPQFVKEIRRSGQVIKKFNPVIINNKICSDQTLKDDQRCLEGVMKDGTGKDLKGVEFEIAGKTGTSKLSGAGGKYQDEKNSLYQASFVGYFPTDKPMYSCIVMISKPRKEIYGARVSGTVFAAIANKVYASTLKYHKAINETTPLSYNLPKVKSGNKRDITALLKMLKVNYQLNYEGEWLTADTLAKKVQLDRKKINKNLVPNVIGMTAKDAVYLLENR